MYKKGNLSAMENVEQTVQKADAPAAQPTEANVISPPPAGESTAQPIVEVEKESSVEAPATVTDGRVQFRVGDFGDRAVLIAGAAANCKHVIDTLSGPFPRRVATCISAGGSWITTLILIAPRVLKVLARATAINLPVVDVTPAVLDLERPELAVICDHDYVPATGQPSTVPVTPTFKVQCVPFDREAGDASGPTTTMLVDNIGRGFALELRSVGVLVLEPDASPIHRGDPGEADARDWNDIARLPGARIRPSIARPAASPLRVGPIEPLAMSACPVHVHPMACTIPSSPKRMSPLDAAVKYVRDLDHEGIIKALQVVTLIITAMSTVLLCLSWQRLFRARLRSPPPTSTVPPASREIESIGNVQWRSAPAGGKFVLRTIPVHAPPRRLPTLMFVQA